MCTRLRDGIGFDGMLVSDDLEMQAIAARNPLNWVVQIGRTAVSAQPDWAAIGVRCGGLLVLAVACVAVSVVTFRSYQKNV